LTELSNLSVAENPGVNTVNVCKYVDMVLLILTAQESGSVLQLLLTFIGI